MLAKGLTCSASYERPSTGVLYYAGVCGASSYLFVAIKAAARSQPGIPIGGAQVPLLRIVPSLSMQFM